MSSLSSVSASSKPSLFFLPTSASSSSKAPISAPLLPSKLSSARVRSLLSCSSPPPSSKPFPSSSSAGYGYSLGGLEFPAFGSSAPQTPATAMRGADADVMGLLLRERIVFLGSSIDDLVADAIISQILLLDAQDPTKDIRLFINSPGGSISATMAIYDVVQLVRADVSTVALGLAASTASIILGSGTKGKRFAMPNTRIMLHQPLGGASGQAIDVEIQAKEIMHNKNNITRLVASFTGRSYEQVQKDIDRDRYMGPIEAVEYGIIDGVIDRDAIITLQPVPERVKPKLNYEEISKDPSKFLRPEIPDDEIY